MLTFFNAGAAGSQNIWTLLILRFFAGAFGSSPLTNAGGVIADMFPAEERGLAMSLFAAAPFLGPTLGPIIGGFAGETIGWRWVEGIMAIFTGVLWFAGWAFIPETYPPVLLRQRAAKLSQLSGKVYKSKSDVQQGEVSAAHAFKTALSRPWVLLFREPIVFLLSIYMAIIVSSLYAQKLNNSKLTRLMSSMAHSICSSAPFQSSTKKDVTGARESAVSPF